MDPKMHQHRAPEAPKTLLEPGCRWKFGKAFGERFSSPECYKNLIKYMVLRLRLLARSTPEAD